MATKPILFSSQNRRMAFRHSLDDNAFSLLYNDKYLRCLNISIQGCQIDYCPKLAKETIVTCQLNYGINVFKKIQVKIIRIESDAIALHFTKIESDTRIIIEDYLLEIQKKELRFKKANCIKENERKLLGI